MALILVVASCLALLPLSEKPNSGPRPISKSVQFEVFIVAATSTPNASSFTDPDTGATLHVAGPPIITGADVSTIQLTTDEQNQGHACLHFTLGPAGGNKLLKATTAAIGGRLVVVIDGNVLAAARVSAPIGHQFSLTGGRIHTDGNDILDVLTAK